MVPTLVVFATSSYNDVRVAEDNKKSATNTKGYEVVVVGSDVKYGTKQEAGVIVIVDNSK